MPDYGGAYGWINREGTDALGPNHADTSGWCGDHSISDELQADFAAWQTEFEAAPMDRDAGIALLDWPRFHERGMALARRLKAELGDAVRIYYEKPVEDPNQCINERVEILAGGAIVETVFRRRLQTSLPDWLPNMVVSGGQTGVDRAALDWACNHRIPHGGWCPQGRRASDGPLSLKYQLRETESAGYRQRTKLNVQDSDATLILNVGELDGGTQQTLQFPECLFGCERGRCVSDSGAACNSRANHPVESISRDSRRCPAESSAPISIRNDLCPSTRSARLFCVRHIQWRPLASRSPPAVVQ